METFRIAFYKAKFGDKKWIDDGISIYTTAVNAIGLCLFFKFKMAWKVIKNRYSHVEIWWEKYSVFDRYDFIDEAEYYMGGMFTSTMRQGMAGTVIREADGVLTHPERWDIMEVEATHENLEWAKAWARDQAANNLGYNKKTIGNFFNPLRPTQKPKEHEENICSVAGQGFCWKVGIFKVWRIWSPIKFWWKMTKLGYETKPLIEM